MHAQIDVYRHVLQKQIEGDVNNLKQLPRSKSECRPLYTKLFCWIISACNWLADHEQMSHKAIQALCRLQICCLKKTTSLTRHTHSGPPEVYCVSTLRPSLSGVLMARIKRPKQVQIINSDFKGAQNTKAIEHDTVKIKGRCVDVYLSRFGSLFC